MIHAKLRSDIPAELEKKQGFIIFAIFSTGCHLGFSTRLNFQVLMLVG